ncbi:hypothetical protein QBC39DRAFT_313058 [Podospora conica]|nr:hypothetical protein QBC39DRAFT_313058 [Schizothecium conicum]
MPPQLPTPKDSPPTPTIDDLLARYLLLLDQYTTLRATLSSHSTALFLGLARARFSAQRGGRPLGPDSYDMRMQAGRRVRIKPSVPSTTASKPETGHGRDDGDEGVVFEVIPSESGEVPQPPKKDSEEDTGKGVDPASRYPPSEDGRTEDDEHTSNGQPKPQDDDKDTKPAKKIPSNDPLRWFGILTPAPLRDAQKEAVEMVEEVIPRLASLDAEMAAIELAVRRARKKRVKAEVAARKAEVAQQAGEVMGEGGVEVGC